MIISLLVRKATNIYDAVPEESIVDYNNNDDGEGTISVEESGFGKYETVSWM